jgi:hydrogenase-4 membrane subunit HyfE
MVFTEPYLRGATTLRLTTFGITALSLKGLYVTLSITDTERNNAPNYSERRVLFIAMLSVIMLSVVMLGVVAPFKIVLRSLLSKGRLSDQEIT